MNIQKISNAFIIIKIFTLTCAFLALAQTIMGKLHQRVTYNIFNNLYIYIPFHRKEFLVLELRKISRIVLIRIILLSYEDNFVMNKMKFFQNNIR